MQKQKMLFVTFDLIRPDDPPKSLAAASILAALKNCDDLRGLYEFEHLSINVFTGEDWQEKVKLFRFGGYSYIAVSAYVWGERYVNDFLAYVCSEGFGGKIILGGYQIANDTAESYRARYPLADIFIEGFAELKLLRLLTGKSYCPRDMASVYLTGEIEVRRDMPMVRLETKRGCPYECSFCRHRDIVDNSRLELGVNRVWGELDLIISMGVRKINIVDPIFHVGHNYMGHLSEMISLCESRKADTVISLQCRIEFLASDRGRRFLGLCERGNFELEFGLQTCNEWESGLINRKNDLPRIEAALKALNSSKIPHEISLIYGLPGQTLESFSAGVDFLKQRSRAVIRAYPLKLLRGTPLFKEKEKYGFEEKECEYGIPHVISSSSFTYSDWLKMREIAEQLNAIAV